MNSITDARLALENAGFTIYQDRGNGLSYWVTNPAGETFKASLALVRRMANEADRPA